MAASCHAPFKGSIGGTMSNRNVSRVARRQVLTGMMATGAALGVPMTGSAQGKVAPITVVINQSPWFDSFRKTVEAYEKESGNKVELDVNPFAGSLEKQRNSVRAAKGQYDLLIMNSGWFAEMYFGGFVEALTDIDPAFKLDKDIFTLNDTVYFDPVKKTMSPSGKLMSMPISPLIPVLYYRGDLYKEAGLKAPETFAELENNARKLNKPPRMYGIVQRGARGPATVSFDFYPYLFGFGGSIFKDQAKGDYTVTLNSELGRTALDYYIRLAREAGHPKTAAMDQADLIQNMVTGKTAHVMMVISAWSQMDDPQKSAVVDKVEFAATPHALGQATAPGLGHWLGGVAMNVPDERKRAAVEFLRWYQTKSAQMTTAQAGGIPVSAAIYREPLAQERRFRWMKAIADSLPHAVSTMNFPEASEVIPILELGLNQAIAGETTAVASLNSMADQIHAVMAKYKYNTGTLPKLN
jgi:multiple sugar transport system substrate-binding protein